MNRDAVTFDDDHAVTDAGLILTATLLGKARARGDHRRDGRRGLSAGLQAVDAGAHVGGRGDCIGDVALQRAGATSRVLGHDTVAPYTIGTWLRGFTFGHVRQLDKVTETMLTRAWAAGAGPGDGHMFIDVDSTIAEVHGCQRRGASYGSTMTKGYHPLLATRADTGEILHGRMWERFGRVGPRGAAVRRETVGGVRCAGATGQITLRADSGF